MDWEFLATEGAFGGILLMWDKRIVEKVEVANSLSCKFTSVEVDFDWFFFFWGGLWSQP